VSSHDQAPIVVPASASIDTSVAHPARRYDYWLGGKDNFQADRDSADAVAAAWPAIRTAVLENRGFLRRAVSFLAGEMGVRQFLDVGTGLPTANNVHDVAQGIAPQSRIVYVDNDPLVLVHARALLTSSPEGVTAYIDADLHEPEKILNDSELQATLDFSEPVALMLLAVLHFLPDGDDPYAIVARLVDALPPGSYLVLSHSTFDPLDEPTAAKLGASARAVCRRSPRVPKNRSQGSSPGWRSSSRASCRWRTGGPSRSRNLGRRRPKWAGTAPSRASPPATESRPTAEPGVRPETGLALLDQLTTVPAMQNYHLLPSVRGGFLAKLGRHAEARVEFERAASLTHNEGSGPCC
jgi:hypothetical protein